MKFIYKILIYLSLFSTYAFSQSSTDNLPSDKLQLTDYYLDLSEKQLGINDKNALIYAQKSLKLSKDNNLNQIRSLLLISKSYFVSNKDSSLYFINLALNLSEKEKNTSFIATLNNHKGDIFYNKTDYQEAEKYYSISLSILFETKDTIVLIQTYNKLGMTNFMKSNYTKAIEYFIEQLKLAEKIEFLEAQASSKNNIAMTYASDKNYENSLIYYKEAFVLYNELKSDFGIAIVFNNIGNIYIELKNLDSALYYFQKTYKISKKINDDILIAISNTNIAEILILKNDLKNVKSLLDSAITIFQLNNKLDYLSSAFYIYGRYFFYKNDIENSLLYFYKSLDVCNQISNKNLSIKIYNDLSDLYLSKQDYKNSLLFYQKCINLKDSIYTYENTVKINQLKLNYETEKKDNEIKNNLFKILKQKKIIQIFELIVFFFILFIIAVFIFYKKLNKSYKKLVEINLELLETKSKNEQKEIIFDKEKDIIEDDNDEDKSIKKHYKYNLSEEQILNLRSDIKKLIQEEFYLDTEMTLEKMSMILNTNKLYLSQFINSEYNKNFNNFLNQYRIEKAQKLLISNEFDYYSLDGIAKIVGFNSRSTFYATFKKITGVTPLFFKNSNTLN